MLVNEDSYLSTRNACKLCSPLGASIVFKGIKGCLPLIHGSQGCATYIRRYLISHYKEPVDIASSNFSEETTVFGGNNNFNAGIDNIISQYEPEAIGISTTCLSETIGEDVQRMLHEYRTIHQDKKLPELLHVSTPSYQGSHIDGFHEAVLSVIKSLARESSTGNYINIFPGFVSPEDIRHIKEMMEDVGLNYILFPDYSDTLDNPKWDEYMKISPGGTQVEDIRKTGSAKATIEFGNIFNNGLLGGRVKNANKLVTAGKFLEDTFHIPRFQMNLPIGIGNTDSFVNMLIKIAGRDISSTFRNERGRLIDAYIDGHKYVYGKRVIIYGEEDLVIALAGFLDEIGMEISLVASGGDSALLKEKIFEAIPNHSTKPIVGQGWDFDQIASETERLKPDIIIGNSKGYYIARANNIPLVRIGFPIHDRIGGQRLLHVGYKGAQQLFDNIVNALIEVKQNNSPVGYKYM